MVVEPVGVGDHVWCGRVTPRVWVLRNAQWGRSFEIARHEDAMKTIAILYQHHRSAYRELRDEIKKDSYADSHRAGGYTLTREEG